MSSMANVTEELPPGIEIHRMPVPADANRVRALSRSDRQLAAAALQLTEGRATRTARVCAGVAVVLVVAAFVISRTVEDPNASIAAAVIIAVAALATLGAFLTFQRRAARAKAWAEVLTADVERGRPR